MVVHSFNVVLQRIDLQRVVATGSGPRTTLGKHYVLQAIEIASQNPSALSFDGGDNTDVNKKLEEVYQTIESCLSKKGLDFFKSLIPPES